MPRKTANVHILVRRFEDGETDIVDVGTDSRAIRAELGKLAADEAETVSPASFELQSWPVPLPEADTMHGWTSRDLHTLIVTAGEIAATYGTGTDGMDRDDVLSTRQRDILARAARDYRKYSGELDGDES